MTDDKLHILERAPMGDIESTLRDSVNIVCSEPDEMIGYALVSFHASGAYQVGYHVHEMGVQAIDVPDMVRARMQERIFKAYHQRRTPYAPAPDKA